MTKELTTKNQKMITTKQMAETLGVTERTIRNVADSKGLESTFLPFETNGGIQKKRAFNEEQATLIKQEIQGHHNLHSRQIDNVSTDLEMEMLTQKVMQYHIQKAQSLQQQVKQLEAQNTQLVEENKEQKQTIGYYKEYIESLYLPSEVAELLGTSAQRINSFAKALGIIRKLGKTWIPLDERYATQVRSLDKQGGEHQQLKFTEAGMDYICKAWRATDGE